MDFGEMKVGVHHFLIRFANVMFGRVAHMMRCCVVLLFSWLLLGINGYLVLFNFSACADGRKAAHSMEQMNDKRIYDNSRRKNNNKIDMMIHAEIRR